MFILIGIRLKSPRGVHLGIFIHSHMESPQLRVLLITLVMSHSDVKKTFSAATRIPQWREVAAKKVSVCDGDRDAFLMVPGVVLRFQCRFSAMQLLKGCSHNEGPLRKHFFPSWVQQAHWESQARKPHRLQGAELCFEYLGLWVKSPSHVILNSRMYYKRNGSMVTKGIHMQISVITKWVNNEWI